MAACPARRSPRGWTDCAHAWLSISRWVHASPNGSSVCHWRWHSEPGMHRGQRTRVRPLCGAVPGSRPGARNRTGSAHGWCSYLRTCGEVTEEVLRAVFIQMHLQRVKLEGLILKPNMVLPGSTCPKQETVDEVADATVRCLLRTVPAAVPGVAFLSGGQTGELASARLNGMNLRFKSRLPRALAFSFGRAIQEPALEIWHGDHAMCRRTASPLP